VAHAEIERGDVGDDVFIATGAALNPASMVNALAEARINAVVQVNTAVADGEVVPIAWVHVRTPGPLSSPCRHS
jgi:carbonic anhydrase/acetyltransferase-like protein (isoleucine patch superfamily)